MTYCWQEERGQKYYRVQTDDKAIAGKLRRRKGFTPSGTVITNRDEWIFNCKFSRPDIAKKTLSSVTCCLPQIDSEGIISYDPSYVSAKEKNFRPSKQIDAEPTLFGSEKESLILNDSDTSEREKIFEKNGDKI
jgi:hypothetical protein